MRLLLDTHILLWWLKDPEQIGKPALEAIRNPKTTIYHSSVSIWEIAIHSTGCSLPKPTRSHSPW